MGDKLHFPLLTGMVIRITIGKHFHRIIQPFRIDLLEKLFRVVGITYPTPSPSP